MIRNWINEVNTTSFRIITSCLIAFSLSHMVVYAVLFQKYEPTKAHMTILTGILGGLLTMMGFDVLQFVGKRFTNTDYAAAKNPPTQVITHPPSTVKVEGDATISEGKGESGA